MKLAALYASAAVVAGFIVVRGYVFRSHDMVWDAESHQGAQRVATAGAAAADNFGFLIALVCESQVNEAGVV